MRARRLSLSLAVCSRKVGFFVRPVARNLFQRKLAATQMKIRFAIYLIYSRSPVAGCALIKSEGWNWERALPHFAFGNFISLLITEHTTCAAINTNAKCIPYISTSSDVICVNNALQIGWIIHSRHNDYPND